MYAAQKTLSANSYQYKPFFVKMLCRFVMPLWTPYRLAALQLAWASELSSRVLYRIRALTPDLAAFLHSPDQRKKLSLTALQHAELTASRERDPQTLIRTLEKYAIAFLLPEDNDFPSVLREAPDPPFALFIRGAALTDGLRVAVVGTRRITDYGQRATEFIAGELARHRITVVSGLALGADATAHAACVDAGGHTVAVLPGGVDDASIAPAGNRGLAKRILQSGGTLLSERAPGASIQPYHFLQRNRLIAALSTAVVVTEGDHDSGALVTARLALEAGREALAVPGSLWCNGCRGTNELIKQGARPCTSVDDVFTAIGLNNPETARHINAAREAIPMMPEEQRVLDALTEPRTVDDVSRMLQEHVGKTNATFAMLELKGRIFSVGPRLFAKVP
jgi:DNA processing protein